MKRLLPLYAASAFAFLHVPLAVLIVFSFNSSRFTVWEHASLVWYAGIFQDAQMVEAAWNSLIIALVSTSVATLIGTLAAYAMWKRRAPALTATLYLSLVTPEIVTGISLLALFQWLARYVPFRLGLATVVLAHVAFSLAYVTIVLSARLRGMDRSLEEAAQDLGAGEFQSFWRVTLPQMAPAILAAALLALIVSFDDYVITSMVAGVDSETLPMVIYAMARRGPNPLINAASSLILVLFGSVILVSERFRKA